jgi:uncharacterized membrane protein YraQ (UPF0718 family)
VSRYLSPRASKWVSYPAATVGGFVLAVCSCTILPLFAGIWKRGSGLGSAITFLFVGLAVNIPAIAYTGAAIGMDISSGMRSAVAYTYLQLRGLDKVRILDGRYAEMTAELKPGKVYKRTHQ